MGALEVVMLAVRAMLYYVSGLYEDALEASLAGGQCQVMLADNMGSSKIAWTSVQAINCSTTILAVAFHINIVEALRTNDMHAFERFSRQVFCIFKNTYQSFVVNVYVNVHIHDRLLQNQHNLLRGPRVRGVSMLLSVIRVCCRTWPHTSSGVSFSNTNTRHLLSNAAEGKVVLHQKVYSYNMLGNGADPLRSYRAYYCRFFNNILYKH